MKDIGALFFGIVLSLVILEILFRVFDPFSFIIKGQEIVLQKNITTKTTFGNTTVVKNINSLGFIGDELSPANDVLTKFVTIGGSTTACDALQLSDTWPEQLKERLKASSDNIWLNNAGFSGHSTYGHNILFRDHVSKISPDYVFYLIGINDVGLNKKALGDNILIADRDTSNYSLWGKVYYFASENIRIVNTVINLMRSYKAYQLNINDLDFDINSVIFSEDDLELEKLLINAHMKKYIPKYRSRVHQLIEQTRSVRAKPILITQPYLGGSNVTDEITGISLGKIAMPLGSSWAGVGDDWDIPVDKSRKVNANLMWKVLELYNDVVRDLATEKNVMLVDMAKLMPKNTKYYYDMVHYTAEGSQKFAELLHGNMKLEIR